MKNILYKPINWTSKIIIVFLLILFAIMSAVIASIWIVFSLILGVLSIIPLALVDEDTQNLLLVTKKGGENEKSI